LTAASITGKVEPVEATLADLPNTIAAMIATGLLPKEQRKTPIRPDPEVLLSLDEILALAIVRTEDLTAALGDSVGDAALRGDLQRLQTRLELDLAGPPDDRVLPEAQAEDIARRGIAVTYMLTVTKPIVKSLTDLESPDYWLSDSAADIAKEANAIKHMYVAAVMYAYFPPDLGSAQGALGAAEESMKEFPSFVVDKYIQQGRGLQPEGPHMRALVEDLRGLRDKRHSAYMGRPADVIADLPRSTNLPDPHSPSGWWYDMRLSDWLHAIRGVRQTDGAVTPRIAELVRTTAQTVQLVEAVLSGLLLYEQLRAWYDDLSIVLHPVLKPQIEQFYEEIDAKVLKAHFDRYGAAGSSKDDDATHIRDGVQELQAIMARPEWDTLLDDIGEAFEFDATAKIVIVGAAIVVAAAMTAGAAAALVGEGLAATEIGAATVFGFEVASVGAFATEAVLLTVLTREGNALVFGEDPQHDPGFANELGWNAVMLVVLRVSDAGYAGIFKALEKSQKTIAFAVGRVAVSMFSAQAFVELQFAIKNHRLMNLSQREQSVLQSLIVMAGGMAGHWMRASFRDRAGATVDALDPVRVKQLDDARGALVKSLDRLIRRSPQDGPPSDNEIRQFLIDLEKIWTDEVQALAEKFGGDSAGLEAALKPYRDQLQAIELLLAHAGLNARLTFGERPAFRRLAAGVVEYEETALATVQDLYKEPKASLKPVPTAPAGTLAGTLPTGELIFYMPSGDAHPPAPKPSRFAAAREKANQAAEQDEIATAGLARIDQIFPAKGAVDSILAAAATPDDLIALLHLFNDPEFTQQFGKDKARLLAGKRWAIEFARAYGTKRLAHLIGEFGWQKAEGIAEKATGLLESQPPNEAALLDALLTGKKAKILAELGVPKKAKERPPAPSKFELGIKRSSAEWKKLRLKVALLYAGETPARIDAITDVMQAIEAARAGRFKNLGHESKVALLDAYDRRCGLAGFDTGPTNNRRGNFAEWIFLESRASKRRYYLGKVQVSRTKTGVTIIDEFVDGVGGEPNRALELKSDKRVETMTSESEYKGLASKYYADAVADMTNLKDNTTYDLWFVRDPGPQKAGWMMEIFNQKGSPIRRVRFGTRSIDVTPASP
jgi:hypothetical protein